MYDEEGGRHRAFYSPIQDVDYKDIHFRAGERIHIENSFKYSPEEARQLWERSGLDKIAEWSASFDAYGK